MKFLKRYIIKFEKPALIIAAATILTAILMNLEFNLLEAKLYDFRMIHGSQPQASDEITVITIKETEPLSLETHTRLLETLERSKPKGIGYLVDLNQTKQTAWAKKFVASAKRLIKNGTPVLLGTSFDVTGETLPPAPLNSIPHSIAIIHKDGNVFAEDKITRRALVSLHGNPVFHMDFAQRLGFIKTNEQPRGSFLVKETDANYFFFRYHGTPKHTYRSLDYTDVINGTAPIGALENRIILVGTINPEYANDFTFTPFSKNHFTNPKLLIHANILDSIISGSDILRAPKIANHMLTFGVMVFVFWWALNLTPLYGVFATLGLAATFMVMGQILFSVNNLWIRESQPLVGIFLSYYLAVPYRLIQEYKKRWDYQRKNALLIQVEELKTNFLSLVTHDLKTPVARIQGLAEMLMKKGATRMNDADRDTITHMITATDELNRFITSILELNKVESKRLQLNFESKDINVLLERAIDSFRAQALANKIKLSANLEPLFPIRVDASLISKIINNLIDNAIKYSPPNSEIRISSRETGDWIEIAITDQGIGMSREERELLFTRFFRIKNEATTKVAGTGLGLYLTKYFVEAHKGTVEVESEKGLGSTFKIRLPLKANFPKENAHV